MKLKIKKILLLKKGIANENHGSLYRKITELNCQAKPLLRNDAKIMKNKRDNKSTFFSIKYQFFVHSIFSSLKIIWN